MHAKFPLLILMLFFIVSCGSDDSTSAEGPEEDDCAILEDGLSSSSELVPSNEIPVLESVYDHFENSVRESNTTALSGIFLHNMMPLYIAGKRPTGIQENNLTAPQFLSNVSNTNGLELRISNTAFTVLNGIAMSWADFEEVINSNVVSTGVDLFFYVNTSDGWKLGATNNTYTLTGDQRDYRNLDPMNGFAGAAFDAMVDAFNAKDRAGFISSFKTDAPLLLTSEVFEEDFNAGIHSATALYDCIVSGNNFYDLGVGNVSVDVRDQYLARVIADYAFSNFGTSIKIGKLLATMIGTPDGGWKISALGFTH